MNVLAVTSHVVYGHVGGQAAVPLLQAMGHEAWHVPTVLFSNHPGHGGFRGRVLEPALVADLVAGLDERGFLARCDAVLGGYLGDPGTVAVLAGAIHRARAHRPGLPVLVDPVLGDAGRIYVRDGILEGVRDVLLPLADIVTPNRHELGWLAGLPVGDDAAVLAAAHALREQGPGIVVVTSAAETDTAIATLLVTADGATRVETPRLPRAPHGTGDAFAALFLGHWLADRDATAALRFAVSRLAGILDRGADAGELPLVAALRAATD